MGKKILKGMPCSVCIPMLQLYLNPLPACITAL
jgi:hypothetical protein